MKILFLLLGSISLGAIAAHAADTILPAQPLAAAATPKSASSLIRKSPPPTISETSVQRRPDGSLTMNCVQKPNPRLKSSVQPKQP